MTTEPSQPQPSRRETAIRVLILGCIYALAITFVVVLSPSMGVISPRIALNGPMAAADGDARPTR